VLHLHDDGMPYDEIQGQGHRGPKVAKMADFKVCFLLSPTGIKRLTVNYASLLQDNI